MKNLKRLNLFVGIMMIVVGAIKAGSLRPYITGSQKDEKNRNLRHISAKNCNRVKEFSEELIFAALLASVTGDKPSTEPNPSILEQDDKGRTALDIAKEMYAKTGHPDCQTMIQEWEEAEKEARENAEEEQ